MGLAEVYYRSRFYTAYNRTRGVVHIISYLKGQAPNRVVLRRAADYLLHGDSGTRRRSSDFGEDYFVRGVEKELSGYTDYRFLPAHTEPRARAIMEGLGLQPGQKVLDYGCAMGFYVKHFQDFGLDAWGTDVSEYSVANCHDNVKTRIFGTPANPGGLLSAIFGSKYFDMIVAKETLEHVPQEYIPDILAEFRNIGRAALIIVPLSAVDGIDYIDGVSALDATHVVRWSKNTWITLLEKYGSVSYLPKEIVARISGSNKRLQYKGMLSVRVDFSG